MKLTAALFFTAALCLVNGGPALAADETQIFGTDRGAVRITPIYHATAMITAGRDVIYIDPAKPAKHFFLATDGGDLILCDLSPKGYREVSRPHLLDPTNSDGGRPALWCNPTYAHRSVYWRNDKELIRVSLDGDRRN